MIIKNCHQTVLCPFCGKDSHQSGWEAIFVHVKCVHCGKFFKMDGKGNLVETPKKTK